MTDVTDARTGRVLTVPHTGGSDVLTVTEQAVPRPGPEQLLVEVAASGVNFIDVYHRQGVYPLPVPFGLGQEGAGTVVAAGTDVTGVGTGDRVAWATAPGSHADYVLVDAARAIVVPEAVELEAAAAAMLQGMTAHYLVHSTYPIQSGDTVVVHAAAGGTGQLLVQLAKSLGASVIGTASTDAKIATATEAGADVVIRYTDYADPADLAGAIRAANSGSGVAAVYDGVGAATFEASLRSLAPRGTLALFGAASGQVPPFDLQRLNAAGGLFVTRPSLVWYTATREELLWRGTDVLRAIADGSLRVEIGGRYPLADAAKAYDDLEGRRTTGKLLLIP